MEEIHRIISGYKSKLPNKSTHEYLPHVLWILPPQHKNFGNNARRELYESSIETLVDKYPNMGALRLKKVWEELDGSLYLREQNRFTDQGYHDYWNAVDAAIRFWDRTLIEIMYKRQKKNPNQDMTYHPKKADVLAEEEREQKQNKFVWHRKKSPEIRGSRKLPTPPPRKKTSEYRRHEHYKH